MIKRYGPYCIIVMLLIQCCSSAMAQVTKKNTVKVEKYKQPVVQTFLGTLTGKTAVAGVAEGNNAISLPLTIIDAGKLNYIISSYQFAYTRLGITEDEETGKTSPTSDIVADRFTVTPLPAIWQSNITETLHSGETLYFFDIIVFDKHGRRFFAPELKISIQ